MSDNNNTSQESNAVGRRAFVQKAASACGRLALSAGALTVFLALRAGKAAPSETRGALGIVRPPGSKDEDDFLALCIRCTRCADACEPQCIRLFGPESAGLQGTPCIVPETRGCTLCLKCGEACPTGAILPLKTKEEARIGTAVVDKRLCVSHNGTGACGACHTICPLRNKAITQGIRCAPTVHEDHCTGCGMCEEVCIVRDRRAIRVKTDRTLPGVVEAFDRQVRDRDAQ